MPAEGFGGQAEVSSTRLDWAINDRFAQPREIAREGEKKSQKRILQQGNKL